MLDLWMCAKFVFVFVSWVWSDWIVAYGLWVSWMWVGGLWPVGRWWWVVDPWVAVVCWCDCRSVIFAVVWLLPWCVVV